MLRFFALVAFLLICPITLLAQKPAATSNAEAEVRDAVRMYDEALRKGDATALGRFWAEDYTFINPRGELLTRADRLKNVQAGQTAFNSLEHAPKEENIRIYGNGEFAVYTTHLTLSGKYSGEGQQGEYRAMVVWVRRDGRWQQIANQITPVLGK
jgi:ketosteroid isomerase-like protein